MGCFPESLFSLQPPEGIGMECLVQSLLQCRNDWCIMHETVQELLKRAYDRQMQVQQFCSETFWAVKQLKSERETVTALDRSEEEKFLTLIRTLFGSFDYNDVVPPNPRLPFMRGALRALRAMKKRPCHEVSGTQPADTLVDLIMGLSELSVLSEHYENVKHVYEKAQGLAVAMHIELCPFPTDNSKGFCTIRSTR